MRKSTRWIIKGIVYLVAITYLFLPIDVIPDILPVVGMIDDAIAVILAIGVGEVLNFMRKR